MGYLWDAAGQVFSADFWTRLVTRPWEAVIQHPGVALGSGAVAGAIVATGGLALKAAPVVAGVAKTLLGVGKAVAAPASFAVRHPILTFAAVTQANLPTEIVRAFAARPAAPPTPAPIQAPQAVPAPPSTRQTIVQPARGPFIQQGQDWQAMFGW